MEKKRDLSVVYVTESFGGDSSFEKQVIQETVRTLSDIFREVRRISGAKEFYKIYEDIAPEVIIFDWGSANETTLKITRNIKIFHPEDFVVLILPTEPSASFLLEAINVGVNKIMIDPPNYSEVARKIDKATKKVMPKKELKLQQVVVKHFLKKRQNMLLEVDLNNQPSYANNSFLEFFGVSDLNLLKKGFDSLASYILKDGPLELYKGVSFSEYLIDKLSGKKSQRMRIVSKKTQIPVSFEVVEYRHPMDRSRKFFIFEDVSAIERVEQRLYIDQTTKIYSRTKFLKIIEEQFHKYLKSRETVAVVVFELSQMDKVKEIVGQYGRDDLLRNMADATRKYIKPNDIFARYGGDEFIIMFHWEERNDIKHLMYNIKETISKNNRVGDLDMDFHFGISFLNENDTPQLFMNRAMKSLDYARKSERGVYWLEIGAEKIDNEIEKEQSEIIKVFLDIKKYRNSIKIHNTYKGVLLTYKGTIINIGEKAKKLTLKVHQNQTYAMNIEKSCYITNSNLESTIKANVEWLDEKRDIVTLSDLQYTTTSPLSRRQVRIEPKTPIEVLVDTGDSSYKSTMINISKNSIAVLMKESVSDLKKEMPVTFYLSLGYKNLRIRGVLYKFSTGPRRIIIAQTKLDNQGELAVERFITQRKTEILTELPKRGEL